MGASTSWNPQGLSRPLQELLYLYFTPRKVKRWGYEGDNSARSIGRLSTGRAVTLLPLYDKNTFLSNTPRFQKHHCLWKVPNIDLFYLLQMNICMEHSTNSHGLTRVQNRVSAVTGRRPTT